MLLQLDILNIALIDRAVIDFSEGINVLTGETGAGKSVVIDALNFVLGAKADKTMIRHGADFCSVSAVFSIEENSSAKTAMSNFGIEDDTLMIVRKLTSDGKSIFRVNGEIITGTMLRQITSRIVDVFGQSDHYLLLKEGEQLSLIDNYFCGETTKIKDELIPLCKSYDEVTAKLKELFGNADERAIRQDVLRFQIDEIEKAAIKEGEDVELQQKFDYIKSSQKIIDNLSQAYKCLYSEGEAVDCATESYHALTRISGLSEDFSRLADRLDAAVIELDDISEGIKTELNSVDFNEQEKEKIESRIELIKKLKSKYGGSLTAIANFLAEAREKLDVLNDYENLSKELLTEKENLYVKISDKLGKLTTARKNSSKLFSEELIKELKQLGMPNVDFAVNFTASNFSRDSQTAPKDGVDFVEFMFSANLGEPVLPLSKIISGGELSRFMLAVKALTAHLSEVQTYIFDEIDTGISGETARAVACKIAKIAKKVQVIVITHLPQIASFADISYLIKKVESNDRTQTFVKKTEGEERINELVRLVGGNSESVSAKAHAKELIAEAEKFKEQIKE